MRALVFHFSSLVGLLVMLNQLTNTAEIERTLVMAFGAGLIMYTVLMVGFAVAHRIMAAMLPEDTATETASTPDTSESGADHMNPQAVHPTT